MDKGRYVDRSPNMQSQQELVFTRVVPESKSKKQAGLATGTQVQVWLLESLSLNKVEESGSEE